ncbi:MAG: HD-GYP domain-containing protein [Ruminiclostridium sp.]|nr:HD-GYP domain-containing protein [Ruminiclostridium sp.]
MKKVDYAIKSIFVAFLLAAIAVFIFAIFGDAVKGEVSIGNFDYYELSDNWTLISQNKGTSQIISLPFTLEKDHDTAIILSNKLPDSVRSGMHFCFRSTRQDVVISVNGEVRADYRADNYDVKHSVPVSAYVIGDLYDEDASGEITLEITLKESSSTKLNTLTYAYGNNIWYPYVTNNLTLTAVAIASIFAGLFCIIGYLIIRRKVSISKSVLYLAETIIVIGFWVLSESEIRQLIFRSPSLSNIFAFVFIEIGASFGAMYFNEVQSHRYDKVYVVLEAAALFQVSLNTIFNFMGIADYYNTLILSHIISGFILLWCFIAIVNDIRTKRIKEYSITAFGMLFLIIACVFELIFFYIASPLGLGVFLSIGLIILLAATILQTTVDAVKRSEERRINSEKMTRMTFRTIASTIDAKDEYTGGHSERVGEYAGMICEKIWEKEHLTEADVERIKYIGKMHDIGKIGVPDKVLNKNGQLTDEEFEVMKSHTVIGSEIIGNIDNVDGLNDGVRHHHERYDGKGYPDGLKGVDISLFARILCLADCYDAMTTDRVYRKRLPKEKVIEEISFNKGKQFDPDLADIVLQMIETGELEG